MNKTVLDKPLYNTIHVRQAYKSMLIDIDM